MDRLKGRCRVEQEHIDPASPQQALGAGGQASDQPSTVLQDPRRPDKQIHIATTQGIVNARPEQQHFAIGSYFLGEMRFQCKAM